MSENEKMEGFFVQALPDQKSGYELMNKLADTARPDAVFGAPVSAGDFMLITASEVNVGLGFGYGGGGGVEGLDEDEEGAPGSGYGGGGGGGGTALGRPVAVIELGPAGVRVEPIVDPTKIVIAFFTTLGAMFFSLSRMRRGK